jgi:hypothetical protein
MDGLHLRLKFWQIQVSSEDSEPSSGTFCMLDRWFFLTIAIWGGKRVMHTQKGIFRMQAQLIPFLVRGRDKV